MFEIEEGEARSAGVVFESTLRRRRERVREVFTGRKVDNLSPGEMERARRAGYEPDGEYLVGRDPREMTRDELEAMGHVAMSPMEAIRAKCLDCCAGSAHEVRCCVAMACPSWPFRTGRNPWRREMSEEQREARRQRALQAGLGSRRQAQAACATAGRPSGVGLPTPEETQCPDK